jgi:two-component system sensor histidine kinase RegB
VSLALEPDVTLPWLIRLRWLALGGQVVALAVAWRLGLDLHWRLLCAAVAVGALSNVGFAAGLGALRRRYHPATLMGAALVLDIALLTVLLAASGGATNPFTVLYLVHITLSAVVLSARWTLVVAALSVGAFGLMVAFPLETGAGHMGHGDPYAHLGAAERAAHVAMGHIPPGQATPSAFDHHVQGMWIAFVLATLLTAFFVRRITLAIASQREQIASLRETSARNARLAAITTLAAGAAHELGSPLGTIAVAAHEANLGLAAGRGADAVGADLRQNLLEVESCQHILHPRAGRAAHDDHELELVSPADLAERIRERLGDAGARVAIEIVGDARVQTASERLVQSVVAMVKNGLDASAPPAPVSVAINAGAAELRIEIADKGSGIAGDDLARVGEPFFTTKQPGRGLGLGVFLARAFFESRGGTLSIESTPGHGTRTSMRLPRERAAREAT